MLANWEADRQTKLYVDDGLAVMASMLTQGYKLEGMDQVLWRLVSYFSWAKITTELDYGKFDGESLGVISAIKEHGMYLYGTKFTCVVDHEPLVPLYYSHSRDLLSRVTRQQS